MIEFALNLLLSRILEEKKKESELKSYDNANASQEQSSVKISIHGGERSKHFGDLFSNQNLSGSSIQKIKAFLTKLSVANAKLRITSIIDIIAFITFTFSFLLLNLVYYIALL